MLNFVADRVVPFLASILVLTFACMVACFCTAVYGGWEWVMPAERVMDWLVPVGLATAGGLMLVVLSVFAWMKAEDHFNKVVARSEAYLLLQEEKDMWRTSYESACKEITALWKQRRELKEKLERLEALVPMTETETAALDADIENGRDMLVTYLAPQHRA